MSEFEKVFWLAFLGIVAVLFVYSLLCCYTGESGGRTEGILVSIFLITLLVFTAWNLGCCYSGVAQCCGLGCCGQSAARPCIVVPRAAGGSGPCGCGECQTAGQ